jgi:eukaryotic-like serine/threonine-protein kinase
MSHRRRNILLSLLVISFFFDGCKKSMSSDSPLPASYYPSVIINSDNNVIYAVDPGTGKKNWEYSLPHPTGVIGTYFAPSPLVYRGMVYMATPFSDTIYKINAKTGVLVKKLVTDPHNFYSMQATPIADGKLLYLATNNNFIYAIDTGTGKIEWKFDAGSSLLSSPTIYNGNIYFGSTGGHVFCIDKTNGPDATTGDPVWDYPGKGVTNTPSPSFVSSPAISAPFLYIGSATDSSMYCIHLDTDPAAPTVGILRWTYKTAGNITSSPTAFAGKCIFGSNDFYVYCLDTQTHTYQWRFHTTSQINSSPYIHNQVVYIGSNDYNLYALNIIDGHKKWSFASNGLLKSSPLPYKGNVFIGSYDGTLYAVDSATGVQKWKYYINGNIQCSPAVDDLSGSLQINSGVSGYVQ